MRGTCSPHPNQQLHHSISCYNMFLQAPAPVPFTMWAQSRNKHPMSPHSTPTCRNVAGGQTPASSLDCHFAVVAASWLCCSMLLHEPYLHKSAHSKQIQIDYQLINQCSLPPPSSPLSSLSFLCPPSFPSLKAKSGRKREDGVQHADCSTNSI